MSEFEFPTAPGAIVEMPTDAGAIEPGQLEIGVGPDGAPEPAMGEGVHGEGTPRPSRVIP